jgi:transposase
MALFWLSDEAWAAIEPHLPRNQPGARMVDDRRVISGILHALKVDCRWCDRPAEYGPRRPSTTGSTAGRAGASGSSCSMRWSRLAR